MISLSSGLAGKGVVLSANEDNSNPQPTLSADMVKNVSNITYDWLPATLDLEAYGSHNGKNHMAYTFNLANNGQDSVSYRSVLKITDKAHGADEACRVMIYRNGEPTVYAKPNTGSTSVDGSPEPFETIFRKVIPSDYKAPSKEELEAAAREQNREFVETTGEELPVTIFQDDATVFDSSGVLNAGETVRYTIVLWIEGEDPECVDEIRDGYVKLQWSFE